MRTISAALAAFALLSGAALAFDAAKVPSPNYNRMGVDRLTIQGPGSTGDVSGMSVVPSGAAPDGTLAKRLHTPTFGGPVTAPSIALGGAGSTGPIDGMTAAGRSLQDRARDVVNVRDAPYNAKCDGVTDDAAAINAALTAAAPAAGGSGSVYVPRGICRLGTNAFIPSGVDFWTHPGSATLKPTPGRAGSVLLIRSSNTTGASVRGFNLDGDINGVGDKSTVVQVFGAKNFTLDGVYVYDTRGLAVLFSNSSHSGVKNSRFNNTGTYFTTTGQKSDRLSAVTFTGDAATRPTNVGNYATGNSFERTGLDQVAVTWQTGTVVSNNAFGSFATQWPIYNSFSDYPSHVYGADTANLTITGNAGSGAPGNGIDMAVVNGVTISGNSIDRSGQAGIMLSGSQNAVVVGNICNNSGQALAALPGSIHRGGLSMGPTANANVTYAGNRCTDTQATKTQPYGIYSTPGLTHTGIWVDTSNDFSGNAIAAFGGEWAKIGYTSTRGATRSAARPDYVAGWWYTARGAARAGTSSPQAANTLYVSPLILDGSVTIQALALRINTAVAGTNARVGIYAAAGSQVTTLLAQGTGELSGAAVATVSTPLTTPVTLDAGVYWLAVLTSGPMEAQAVANVSSDISAILGSSSATNVLAGDIVGKTASAPYANGLPADASGLGFGGTANSTVPRVSYQVQ